jgi:Carboxypeptidase regulatory-like domain
VRKILLIVFSTLLLLVRCFAEGDPVTPGSIRGEVVTKTRNGEPAVLPDARIVLHGPTKKETQSEARGEFAIDGLPPGIYNIEASAPSLNATLTVEVKTGTTSVVSIELGMASVASDVTVAAGEHPVVEESAEKSTIGERPAVAGRDCWRPQSGCFQK